MVVLLLFFSSVDTPYLIVYTNWNSFKRRDWERVRISHSPVAWDIVFNLGDPSYQVEEAREPWVSPILGECPNHCLKVIREGSCPLLPVQCFVNLVHFCQNVQYWNKILGWVKMKHFISMLLKHFGFLGSVETIWRTLHKFVNSFWLTETAFFSESFIHQKHFTQLKPWTLW